MISATHNYEIVWYILHKIQFGCLELLFSIRFKERYKKLNREKKLNSFQSGMSKTKIKNSQFDSYSRLGAVQLHCWQNRDCYIKSSAGWLGKIAIVWWLWMSVSGNAVVCSQHVPFKCHFPVVNASYGLFMAT